MGCCLVEVICDEAHVMRTISTLLGKAMRKIKARCRILLTGTPVQHLVAGMLGQFSLKFTEGAEGLYKLQETSEQKNKWFSKPDLG